MTFEYIHSPEKLPRPWVDSYFCGFECLYRWMNKTVHLTLPPEIHTS